MNASKMMMAMSGALLLAACGGDDTANAPLSNPPGATLCHAIGGGGDTVVYTQATGAEFSQPNNVFDADFTTFAVLDTPNGTGTSSIRGVQQPGLVEPAGGVAGVLLSAASMIAASKITVTTFLNGTQQDTGASTATATTPVSNNYFYGLSTTKPYNSIQVSLALMNDPVQVNLFELCVKN